MKEDKYYSKYYVYTFFESWDRLQYDTEVCDSLEEAHNHIEYVKKDCCYKEHHLILGKRLE